VTSTLAGRIDAVVLDIEGTTSSTGFVHATLYPYSRERFRTWIGAHAHEPEVMRQVESVRSLAGHPSLDIDGVVAQLGVWLDGDEKVTALKAFQGWIWDEGFAAGDLTSHFFDDAIPAIRRWHAEGRKLFVFSSGSLAAQRAWFGHTPDGDLLPLFSGHFDTETAGPKRVVDSYRAITDAISVAPTATVFLSDLTGELDAARNAGWRTIGVRRLGDQWYDSGVGDHPAVHCFDEVDLDDPGLLAHGRAA
jgi:enolase-phosphatase E1